ncbi:MULTISPECIES: Sec-independent protein translocase protein TatB [unclassified Achromobacter]|uniref:Sec-independent protein translocase protein TatB n=1 Tax=unclassified Achromobacter TaxID=2626865 RepID=UPI001EF25295|nr:Sec-independent protein translocase protein TatB [Achromobacter sp. ACRQX]MCG7327436.1 Sec-independent protein translocase protein TatB [Achromobacter sp. ACRQX]
MFDVSLTELMVIGVVALIVIGPERLPKVARTVGHLLGRAQRYVNDVKSDIQREIELDELRKFKTEMEDAAQGVQQSLNETGASLQEPVQQFRAELDEVAREASGKATPAVAQAPVTAQVADAAQAPAAGSPAADASVAGASAEPARTIAPPSQNHNLDLDLPAAEPAPRPAAAPQPPAPAPSAPAADVAAPAAKPVSPSGTPS